MDANSALGAAQNDYQALISKKSAETAPVIDKASAALDQPRQAVPQQEKIGAAPAIGDFKGDAAMWANAMAAFSVIAGGLSKTHGTAALKAFGAGMKGFNEGSQQAFDDAHKTWEANTKAALDNNKMKMDEYHAVLDDRALTVSEAEQKIKMIAYKYQDQMMMDADRFDLQAALVQAQVKATMDLTNYDAKLKLQKKMWDEKQNPTGGVDISSLKPNDVVPGTGLTAAAVKLKAEQYKNDPSVLTRGGLSKADKEAIVNESTRQELADGLSGGDISASQAGYKADTHSLMRIQSMTDSAEAYENTMVANMHVVDSLMDKGAGTSAGPVVNRWLQAGKKATGDPDVAAFDSAIKTVVTEAAKIQSGSLGNQALTDSARSEAADTLDKYGSPDQIKASFGVLKQDSDNKKKEYRNQVKTIKDRISGKTESATSANQKIPADAPTATNDKGEKMYWNGTDWVK